MHRISDGLAECPRFSNRGSQRMLMVPHLSAGLEPTIRVAFGTDPCDLQVPWPLHPLITESGNSLTEHDQPRVRLSTYLQQRHIARNIAAINRHVSTAALRRSLPSHARRANRIVYTLFYLPIGHIYRDNIVILRQLVFQLERFSDEITIYQRS